MFTQSADVYDAIYAFKDYAAEASAVATQIRVAVPDARWVLDVACGTGEHARYLAADHGFRVDGIDVDVALLQVARRKHQRGRFVAADMSNFALSLRYDAILSLFSSIGYLVTLDRVRRAFDCFREHLADNGVVLLEPWFAPGALEHGRVTTHTGRAGGLHVERVARTHVQGRVSRLFFDYLIDDGGVRRSASEVHDLGLFEPVEIAAAFRACGLTASFDPEGLTGRGLWIARKE
jgi:SAM-dependent methyltransferase